MFLHKNYNGSVKGILRNTSAHQVLKCETINHLENVIVQTPPIILKDKVEYAAGMFNTKSNATAEDSGTGNHKDNLF